ncbi:N-acetyl-gamma-aminoadipyl-phosphate [Aeropyrum camini SY1 = JCM 12091]|uniref:N-acetyl-gamma-glutamyl-phosphate reductase n=2 Tax=Aeropyrum camini TaxID=229980 RepID=U3TEC6_9CREN|nr:N-acetyl-gamma-aminoadipyl-phosphate [Aeropyrum camini SY1 = JCM 12091]
MTGGELLRILATHPGVEVAWATSREYIGKPIHAAHPHLRGFYQGLRFEALEDVDMGVVNVVFNALPHSVGTVIVAEAFETGIRVVDLSADYRLKDPDLYPALYGFKHPRPDLLEEAVYALPEIYGEKLRGARLSAVPGCNATAAILAAAPLAASNMIEKGYGLIVDVKAASSEAGSRPGRHNIHPLREGSARPYSPWGHRHAAEAAQVLRELAGEGIRVSLVPHAVSMTRGVLASAHAWLREGYGFREAATAYASFYSGSPMVRIKPMAPGLPGDPPDVKNVLGSMYAEVGFAVEEDSGRITGFAAIDNLVRGAAGQAVYAMNAMLGFDEWMGLHTPPIRP